MSGNLLSDEFGFWAQPVCRCRRPFGTTRDDKVTATVTDIPVNPVRGSINVSA